MNQHLSPNSAAQTALAMPTTDARARGLRCRAVLGGGLLVTLGLLAAPELRAELLCDCTQVVDSCSASVGLDGTEVSISSDTAACSRVDYLIEGQPFTALVVGGSSALQWPGLPQRNASIVVENCRVCAEAGAVPAGAAADAAPAAQTNAATEETDPRQPIIKLMPSYPRDAWMNKLEGDVVVEYAVDDLGGVKNIRVVRSSNAVFELPAIDAVSRFKFAPASESTERSGLREEFRFRLLDGGTRTSVSSVSP